MPGQDTHHAARPGRAVGLTWPEWQATWGPCEKGTRQPVSGAAGSSQMCVAARGHSPIGADGGAWALGNPHGRRRAWQAGHQAWLGVDSLG